MEGNYSHPEPEMRGEIILLANTFKILILSNAI